MDQNSLESSRLIGNLHTEISGRGPPILLIHGFGASTFTWSKIVVPLAANHTVIAVDLKGFGQSPKPRDGRYSLRDQVEAVMQVIEALDLTGLTVIGHSMGGGVALLVAMRLEQEAPARLSRIILIDSIAWPQRLPFFMRVLRTPVLGELAVRLIPPRLGTLYILGIAYFDWRKIERSFIEAYAAPLRCADGRAALIATARAMIPPDIDQLITQYRDIRTPVLVLWGRRDRIVPAWVSSRLKDAIPSASVQVLDRCGHVPQEELPEMALPIITKFLGPS